MKPRTLTGVEAELREAMAADDWDRVAALGVELDGLDQPAQPVPALAAALWYAQHGLHVFPLQPLSKVPYPRSRGCKEATTDTDRITRFWTANATANVGLATGHLIDVVDIDGLRGHLAWTEHVGPTFEDGVEEVLATVSTPRPGGLHLYVRNIHPEANGAALFPGVDYRASGGYVLAPPSVLDDRVLDARTGKRQHPGTYRFLRPLHPEQL